MSDINEIKPEDISTKPVAPNSTLLDINGLVKNKLAVSGSTVWNKVVEQLVQVEVDNRVAKIHKLLAARNTAAKELEKLRPDVVQFNPQYGSKSESYSKDVWEKREKKQKAIEAADAAATRAFLEGNYEPIDKVIQQLSA